MKKYFTGWVLILVLFQLSCKKEPNCPSNPPYPVAFSDSVYRLFPVFNEMIGKYSITKRYWSLQDTIEITFTRTGVESYSGNKDMNGCYKTAITEDCICFTLDNKKNIGRVSITSENSFGGKLSQNTYNASPTISSINFNGNNYISSYQFLATNDCNGLYTDIIYRDAILLANTQVGLFFIDFKTLNKKYYLIP